MAVRNRKPKTAIWPVAVAAILSVLIAPRIATTFPYQIAVGLFIGGVVCFIIRCLEVLMSARLLKDSQNIKTKQNVYHS